MGRTRPRLRPLTTELARRFPHLADPDALIVAGEVLVDGFPRTNPESLISARATVRLRPPEGSPRPCSMRVSG